MSDTTVRIHPGNTSANIPRGVVRVDASGSIDTAVTAMLNSKEQIVAEILANIDTRTEMGKEREQRDHSSNSTPRTRTRHGRG